MIGDIKMERKVTRIGNSLGVTLTEAFKKLGIEHGDDVKIEINEQSGEIVIRKKRKHVEVPEGMDSNFFESLAKGMNQYDKTLKGLKDR
jgi:antitoxin MazE